jgi:branched-chain amino acid transport system ATP-binding protein
MIPRSDAAPILDVRALRSGYGKIEALKGISLVVPAGQIVALIGSNGAGKSTFLMTLSGVIRPWSGQILFENSPIHTLAPDRIVQRGVIHVPEGRRVFARMTVEENLDLGGYSRPRGTDLRSDKDEMFGLFPILKTRRASLAGNLSGGEQQMLAMARALMAKPQILLLDEPSLGLAPKMVDMIFALILRINATGIPVLLVEQNAFMALEIAHHAYVIESGMNQLEGTGQELLKDPKVKTAYLGA